MTRLAEAGDAPGAVDGWRELDAGHRNEIDPIRNNKLSE